LGERVRFDGGHKLDRYLTGTLGFFVGWVSICPEVEIGLPIEEEVRLNDMPLRENFIERDLACRKGRDRFY
jgi:uncharacterized protein YbbK (DUF523 family)